jgi:transcriptional regulator with XRE-family HTH domain
VSENLESNVGLISKLLNNPQFRDAFIFEHIKNGVAFQMAAMRDKRGWTQARLGQEAHKPRNVITRLEDPNYGQFSIQTLREIAAAFQVGLLVKFVPFSRLLEEYDDVSPQALIAPSVNDPKEARRLKRWAVAKDKAQTEESRKETPAKTFVLVPSNNVGANMLFLDIPRGSRTRRIRKDPTVRTISTNAVPYRSVA